MNKNKKLDSKSKEFTFWGEYIVGELPNEFDEEKYPYLIPHGEGRIVWSDGSIYEGKFEKGIADGKGRLIGPDGTVYQGDFKDG